MNEKEIDNIISKTVNETVSKLKLAGLIENDRKTAYQKTEELLRNYNEFKLSEEPRTKKLVTMIDNALCKMQDDIYYDIIPMTYFDNETRENIAEYFNTSQRTISRNKGRLINQLKIKLFSDDVIFELFL